MVIFLADPDHQLSVSLHSDEILNQIQYFNQLKRTLHSKDSMVLTKGVSTVHNL